MRKTVVLVLAALLVMSSIAIAEGPAPTIISTACTADSDCPSGQTCGTCPAGATCTSAMICIASAGTAPVAVPDPEFPTGSSVVELCRYSLNRGIWRSSETSARSSSSDELRFANGEIYKFEATNIASDGTLTLKITENWGATGSHGPYALTLDDSTGIVTFGPDGHQIKVRKRAGVLVHAYATSVGRHNGLCTTFDVTPASWSNTELPFGTVTGGDLQGKKAWFKDDATGIRKMVWSTIPSASTGSITVTLYSGIRVDHVLEQNVVFNQGDEKIVGSLWVKYDGTHRVSGRYLPTIYIANKDAQVGAAPLAAASIAQRAVSAQAQPAQAVKAAAVPAVAKKSGLWARLFGTKTVAKPAAQSTVKAAVPANTVAAPSKSPEIEVSMPAASAEAMAPSAGAGNCKYIPNSELITIDGYGEKEPQEICSELGYASCLLGYMYNSFGYYGTTDKSCTGNVQWTDLQYEPVSCNIRGSHEVHCIESSEPYFGSRTQVRYVHSAICCK